MSCYVIAVGGTGAKCLEAVVHLCGAGAISLGTVTWGIVDPDNSNGSVIRAREAVEHYLRARSVLHRRETSKGPNTYLFETLLREVSARVWSPFREGDEAGEGESTLESVFDDSEPAVAKLMAVLFSAEERSARLDGGFRGRPAIGAAVMAQRAIAHGERFWDPLFRLMQADSNAGEPVHVVFVGSVFGGTGAAGVPAFARVVRAKAGELGIASLRIGAVLMLPYFSFGETGGNFAANAAEFLHNSRAALEYYRSRESLRMFDAVYLIGNDPLEKLEAIALDGREQANPPHICEVCAALAVADFVSNARPGFSFCGRREAAAVTWGDLPAIDHALLKSRLFQSIRLAIALETLFGPMLEDIKVNGRHHRAPWFVDLFSRPSAPPSYMDDLTTVRSYTRRLLEWQASVAREQQGVTTHLFRLGTLTDERGELRELDNSELSNCLNVSAGELEAERLNLSDVWTRVCGATASRAIPVGVPGLVRAVHAACI